MFQMLFLNGVGPILDYCSEVWVLRNHHSIEMVQNRALRYYLVAPRIYFYTRYMESKDGHYPIVLI